MITTCSKKLVEWLVCLSETPQDEDQIEVYVYGMECFLNTAITVLFLAVFGIIMHTFFETIFWVCAFILLRHYTGGFHAPTQLTCILSSSLLGISNWFAIQYMNPNAVYTLIIILLCMTVCFLFAPIDSKKFELTKQQTKRKKIISILILTIGFLIAIILHNELSNSILYAFLCVNILIFIAKINTVIFPYIKDYLGQ